MKHTKWISVVRNGSNNPSTPSRPNLTKATLIFIMLVLAFSQMMKFWDWIQLPYGLNSLGALLTISGVYGYFMWYIWYATTTIIHSDFQWDMRSSSFTGLVICLSITASVVCFLNQQPHEKLVSWLGTLILLLATLIGAGWPTWSTFRTRSH